MFASAEALADAPAARIGATTQVVTGPVGKVEVEPEVAAAAACAAASVFCPGAPVSSLPPEDIAGSLRTGLDPAPPMMFAREGLGGVSLSRVLCAQWSSRVIAWGGSAEGEERSMVESAGYL